MGIKITTGPVGNMVAAKTATVGSLSSGTQSHTGGDGPATGTRATDAVSGDSMTEPRWNEYPQNELAELVPLLRRRAFDRDIELLARNASPDRVYTLALIDIDHFKRVNDDLGHPAGDAVLMRVAEIVRAITGRRGTVYRYGGEELAILLPDFTSEEALPVLERIRNVTKAENWPTFKGLRVTISVGIAAEKGVVSPAAIVKSADDALYRAKQNGRDRTERMHPHNDTGTQPGNAPDVASRRG